MSHYRCIAGHDNCFLDLPGLLYRKKFPLPFKAQVMLQAPLAKRAAPFLRSIAVGIAIEFGVGFSESFDCDPDSDSDFG